MQIQVLKSLLYHHTVFWQQTDSYVKFATRDSKETKTSSFTGEATTFHGSSGKEAAPTSSESGSMSAPNPPVSTTTRLGHWVILPESRSISAGNMARRNGNVKDARRNMLSNPTGKLIPRFAALENTSATAEPSSPGKNLWLKILLL